MTQRIGDTPEFPARAFVKLLAILLLGLTVLRMSACNTTEGVGKDVKAAGEGIEDAAQDAKN